MHLHLPIEQLVQRVDTAFQFGFATEAKELLPEGEEFLLNASHRDCMCSRATKRRSPCRAMFCSMCTGRAFASTRLACGSSRAYRSRSRSCTCVSACRRYKAPLADLLGLPAELRKLTEGRAKQSVALSHYAIVTRDPGGKAA